MNELSQPCDITAMTAVLLIHPLLLSPSKLSRPSPLETATCQRGSRCTFPTLFCCCLSLSFPKPSAQSWLSFSSVVAVVILYERMRPVAKVIWHTRTTSKTPTHTHTHAYSTPSVPPVGARTMAMPECKWRVDVNKCTQHSTAKKRRTTQS